MNYFHSLLEFGEDKNIYGHDTVSFSSEPEKKTSPIFIQMPYSPFEFCEHLRNILLVGEADHDVQFLQLDVDRVVAHKSRLNTTK